MCSRIVDPTQKRKMMPAGVWCMGIIPFFTVMVLAVSYTVMMVSLYTGHSDSYRDPFSYPTPTELHILWLALPFCTIFLWTLFAPYRRVYAAMAAGAIYATPCWLSVGYYFDQPDANIGVTQFVHMIIGAHYRFSFSQSWIGSGRELGNH